ncbi:MAG: tetratricopeptide repeat protein, partial [Spirochaetia bacterium]|nr:tetratricopeptide repeat protein [Spirochaetia bacterium]
MKSAQAYVERKDYAAAIIEFQNAIAATPKNAGLHYQLGAALLHTGATARAVASFKTASDLDPAHVDSRVKLADILSRNNDQKMLTIAESYAQAALALRAGDPEILTVLATVEWRQNKTAAAKAHLQEALQKDPSHPKAASNLALMQWTVDHDEAGAEKTFRSAVERSPNSPDALVAFGRFYTAIGKPGVAEAQYQKALASDPNHGVALLELSKLQQSSGRMKEAEQTVLRLSALPDTAYRSSHALFLFQNGQRDAAIQELKASLEKDPTNVDVRSKLIGFYVDANKLDDAGRVIAEALKRDARDADALEQQARLQLVRLQFEEARKSAAEAVRLRPESALAHYLLAKALKGLGFPNGKGAAEHRSEVKLAVEKDPQLVQARLDLSESLRTGKSFTEALDLLDRMPASQKDLPQVLVE